MKKNDLTSKTFRFVIAIIFLVAILVAIQINFFHSDKDKKKESKRTTFTVGFDAAFPPYGYKDESGEYVGFDLDLAAEVAKRNGWKLVKQPIDWDSKDMELKTGSIDCIWNGFTINGRENNYTWSKAYIDNSQVIVVRSDSDIEKKADLKGKNVMVQTDSSALEAFTGEDADEENKALCETFAELQQVSDYNNAFLNLESGSADALCMDIGVASYEVEHRGDDYKILDERISSELYGVGFKLGNTTLRDEVQETLDEMKDDGTFEKIAEKWELSDFVCLGKPGTDEAYKIDKDEKKTSESGMFDTVKELAKGMLSSLLIFILTLIFSMPLGLLVMSARRSKFLILNTIAKVYISILRGTPLMLQLLVVFFGPYYIFGVSVSSSYRFYAVIIGFSLNYAAYFAEIFRAGFDSIPAGQTEAAFILGYTKTQTFWKIMFPQMVKRVIPPVTNEIITLVKDTSLAFALAYTEMFTLAKQIAAAQASILPLFAAGLFYYIFNFIVAFIMSRVEKSIKFKIV